jgi:iron complex transport system substrate-binding protein
MDVDQKSVKEAGPRLLRLLTLVALLLTSACAEPRPASTSAPQRVVSLVPAVTETLFAVGAGPMVVGVSSFDTYPPEVEKVARVGGLIDPDIEKILSLKPDLVFLYGSQDTLIAQLGRAGVAVERYRHGGIDGIVQSTGAIAARVGHAAEGDAVAAGIKRDIAAIRERIDGRARPSTLIVFGREEDSLRGIYASGGQGFIHDMVEAAGGRNVFADVPRESVQASLEIILARAPEVILELRAPDAARGEGWAARQLDIWRAAPSLPAVRNGRVHVLLDQRLVVPGPRVAVGIDLIARALHR